MKKKMEVKFYCKELGSFTLENIPTYRKYKKKYPDRVHISKDYMPYIFDECIELILSK